MNVNPLTFWQQAERGNEFPILRRLTRRYLAIPASSASAERLFSYTGNRVSREPADCRMSSFSHKCMYVLAAALLPNGHVHTPPLSPART